MQQKSENKYKYLAKNSLLFFIASFGSKLLAFLLLPVYTKYLSTAQYGIADLLNTSISLLFFVFTLDIGSAVMRFVMQKKETSGSVLKYGFLVHLIGFAVLIPSIIVFAHFNVINWPIYCYIFLAVAYFFNATNDILSNYAKGLGKITQTAIASLVLSIFTVTSSIILVAVLRLELIGYLSSILIGYISSTIYLLLVTFKATKENNEKIDKNIKIDMLKYCIPLVFSGIGWWMNTGLDKYFISMLLGAEQNGIYAAASKIPSLLSVCFTIFIQAWTISAINEYGDDTKSDAFLNNVHDALCTFVVVLASLIIVFNKPIISILLDPKFAEAERCSPFLLVSSVFSGMAGFLAGIYAAKKKNFVVGVSTIIASLINLGLTYVLIKEIGTIGAAIATTIAFIIIWSIRLIYLNKYIKINKYTVLRSIACYIILILQSTFDYLQIFGIREQIVMLALIVMINHRELLSILLKFRNLILRKRNKNEQKQ